MSTLPTSSPSQSWRKSALVFVSVLIVGGGVGVFLLDRASRDRRTGLEAAQAGNFKKAEPLLKKALEREPGAVEVVEALARGYLEIDDAMNAESSLNRWIELRPDDLAPRKLRFEFLRSAKRSAEAYADGRKVLALEPSNSQLRRNLMAIAFNAGNFADADDLCDVCIREFPGDLDLLLWKANILRARGDSPGAAAILDPLVTRTPPPPGTLFTRALFLRAVIHEEADQPDKAVPLLREVVRLDKTRQRTAGMRLAVVLERTGQVEEAKKVLAEVRRLQDVLTIEEAVAQQPDNLELRVRQGELMLASGYHADGVKMLMSVFDYDRGYRPAHRALAAYFEKSGQPERAAQHRRAAGDLR